MKTSSIIAFLVVSFLSLFVDAMDRELMSMAKGMGVKKAMGMSSEKKAMKRRKIRRQLRRDIISAFEE
jgi:hypothetical protein